MAMVARRFDGRHSASDMMRPKVEQAIEEIQVTENLDRRAAESRFARLALVSASRRNLRIWKHARGSYSPATLSLRTLLYGRRRGGSYEIGRTNHAWVLAIWEAALEDHFPHLADAPRPQLSLVAEPDTLQAGVLTPPQEQPSPTSPQLTEQFLEAWVNRDAELFMSLLIELEKGGR